MTLHLRVNGTDHTVDAEEDTPLIYVLREDLGLTGTKFGCGLEQCGACTVLVDGVPTLSCVTPARDFAGRDITTVEGIAASETGRRVQAAFIETSAAQCGYCTAGLVVAVTGLLTRDPSPGRDAAKAALAPNLCRCGSHPQVLNAVEIASAQK